MKIKCQNNQDFVRNIDIAFESLFFFLTHTLPQHTHMHVNGPMAK